MGPRLQLLEVLLHMLAAVAAVQIVMALLDDQVVEQAVEVTVQTRFQQRSGVMEPLILVVAVVGVLSKGGQMHLMAAPVVPVLSSLS
jgi:hypothetical protein